MESLKKDVHLLGKYIAHTFSTTKVHLTVIIDSIDELSTRDITCWMPAQLPTNAKIILTLGNNTATGNGNILEQLKRKNIPEENFIELTKFSDEQWRDVLSFGGGDFYAANGTLQLPEHWKKASEKTPLQAKILWWLAWLGNDGIEDTAMENIINKIFVTLESKFSKEIVGFLLSAIEASKNGIAESDLLKLFQESKINTGDSPSRVWCKFCWFMGPLLLHGSTIKIMDKDVRSKIIQLYGSKLSENRLVLYNHFDKQARFYVDGKGRFKSANVHKFLQLPYQNFKITSDNQNFESFNRSIFLTDLDWIRDKLIAVGCIPVINDINLAKNSGAAKLASEKTLHLKIIEDCLQTHIHELNYDGEQFFAVFSGFIKKNIQEDSELIKNDVIKKWQEFLAGVTTTYLERLHNSTIQNCVDQKSSGFDKIMNLGGKGYFVATISTEREEICVWDVSLCKKVRTLKGVPHPTSLCPVGEYGAAVLCKREIKVIDLNEGRFKVTLKGVMNQKMPYFGLHDSQHLVCLSRNRMYVNLMNLESGDCVTTFKAGEDRFLNSLLVSGDGRILVCGDETQKPFPLLVWHLSQRKLLYDLRIPHHDFITSLSAITHEGSYVCVVAKELNEPTPNFIVVYDLQSGTLFKKWKPSCNTVSLAISQTNACVVAGLEDARVLVWDLVTGNCRFSLTGHNAPVTLLKLDPLGKVLLSGDTDARDISIRLWELDSGKLLATYTPPAKILACEILSNGKYVGLALENHVNLVTLILRNYRQDPEKQFEEDDIVYGSAENEGKVFQL